MRQYYSKTKPTTDFFTGRIRDFGKYANDQIVGKLGDIAFSKFLGEKFGIHAFPDLSYRPGITAVDRGNIVKVLVRGKAVPPGIKIDVKATTPPSKWFLVGKREFDGRPYDAYVGTVVALPKDHLARFFAPQVRLPKDIKNKVHRLSQIQVSIFGFLWREDVQKKGRIFEKGAWLPDPDNPRKKMSRLVRDNYGLPLIRLRNSNGDWKKLVKKIIKKRSPFYQ